MNGFSCCNKSQEMNIVMAADENYITFVYTTAYSVLEKRGENYRVNFYILVPEHTVFVEYNQNWKFSNYSFEYIEVSQKFFCDASITIPHITKPTYYRLLIPKLLNIDKCLYLDVDVMVCCDLTELYNTNIDNYYLAGANQTRLFIDKEADQRYAEKIGIPNRDKYINAGVLLLNVRKLREEKVVNRFMEAAKKDWPMQDQDIINFCCYDRIKNISICNNLYSIAYGYGIEALENVYDKLEIQKTLSTPSIIHFPTYEGKPWVNIYANKSDEWWELARRALPIEIYSKWQKKAQGSTKELSIPQYINDILSENTVIIMGAGAGGKSLINYIRCMTRGALPRILLFDNIPDDKEIYGVQATKPYYVDSSDSMVIISVQTKIDEIKEQLVGLGYSEDRIIEYKSNHMTIWFSTQKEYRELLCE